MAMTPPRRKSHRPNAGGYVALSGRTVAGAICVCALLIFSGFVPYDRIAPHASLDVDVVEQMPTDPPVTNIDEVIEVYRLTGNVRPYLSVDDSQIRFDAKVPRGGGR